jgi:hypothetical protein
LVPQTSAQGRTATIRGDNTKEVAMKKVEMKKYETKKK